MSVLSNPRHERFCQYLAQGKTASAAYELAGYKPNRANAAQMAHKEHIKKRLTQINAKLGVATQITAETLIARAENEICWRTGKTRARQNAGRSRLCRA